jgi:hypothetical protein
MAITGIFGHLIDLRIRRVASYPSISGIWRRAISTHPLQQEQRGEKAIGGLLPKAAKDDGGSITGQLS